MSFPSLANIEATISEAELAAAASSIGITIPPAQVQTYRKFATAFDTACTEILSLPPYADPRLAPVPTTTERVFTYPSAAANPLNAWSQQTTLLASHPTSTKLRGRTIALKANIALAGADLTIGTAARFFPAGQFHVPQVDATVARRVLEAGATVRGTGTCENFSLSALAITAATGPVRNAWDPTRTTGGSSSGVAVLVSAADVGGEDCVDMAVGGDQGGSIRVPAHFSGIYGLKPTFGLVPYTGMVSVFSAIDHAGPMARSVRDVALLLEVIAGADGVDYRQSPWTPLRVNVPRYGELLDEWSGKEGGSSAKGMTVGVLVQGWEVDGLDDEVAKVTQEAIKRFEAQGAVVKKVSVPMHKMAPLLWAVYNRHGLMSSLTNSPSVPLGHPLVGFEPLSSKSPSGKDTLQSFFEYIGPISPAISNALLNAAMLDQKYGADLTRKTQMHVHELIAAYDEVFETEGLDVIVLPVAGKVAPVINPGIKSGASADGGAATQMQTELDPASAANEFIGVTLNTCAFNLTGHPAMSLPCGWATPKDGPGPENAGGKMPVGLQIVGKKWDELTVLKAAMAWERDGRAMDQLR